MTPAYFTLLKKAGYLGKPNQTFAGETAVAMMLSTESNDNTLCQIESVNKYYGTLPTLNSQLSTLNSQLPIDTVMIGVNGTPENDQIYIENCAKLFPNIPLLHYKHIFGESYTAPALGVYAAAICLKKGKVPEHLRYEISDVRYETSGVRYETNSVKRILCYNHFEGKNHTFIVLSKS
jgi:hypothetical protein